MLARSSLLSLCALTACGQHAPEADPAQVKALAAQMVGNVPVPAAVRVCAATDLAGAPDVTYRTLRVLAGLPLDDQPEQAEWINPVQLDAPAARVLADPAADATLQRQAAAQLLAADAWIVHRVQLVNAPLALGVKELKIGTVGTVVLRYDRKTGRATCAQVFAFQNTRATSDWAISVSDKPLVDKRVQQVLRDDLAAQYLKLVPRGTPSS